MRAVTFDCWGTLITDRDLSGAVEVRIDALCEVAGGRVDPDGARELLARGWRTHHDAWLAGEQFGSPGVARLCATELGLDDGCVDELTQRFEEAALSGVVEALPGAADTLRTLRDAGVPTALICDTGFTPGRIVRSFLEGHGLLEHLDHLVFSNEVGVPKPHPRMFSTALEALGTEPTQAAHVGDLRRTDIAGARRAGMRTVRIACVNDDPPAPELPEADAVASSHPEVLAALRGFGAQI